eukprot:scaffold263104_cov17-Tisochrysis_lutea.AAC.1
MSGHMCVAMMMLGLMNYEITPAALVMSGQKCCGGGVRAQVLRQHTICVVDTTPPPPPPPPPPPARQQAH